MTTKSWHSIIARAGIATCLFLGSCGQPQNSEQAAGWVTSCTGPDFAKPQQRASDERPVFRVNEQLVLSIPKSQGPYGQSLDHVPMKCRKITDLPLTSFVHFHFQAHTSEANARGVGPIAGRDGPGTVTPDFVNVRIDFPLSEETARPGAPGGYPPNVERRVEEQNSDPLLKKYLRRQEFGDFHCSQLAGGWWYCFGKRPEASGVPEIAFEYAVFHPDPRFVEIHAGYYSIKYGGIDLDWNAVTSSASNWREIDDQVWKHLEEWNLIGRQARGASP